MLTRNILTNKIKFSHILNNITEKKNKMIKTNSKTSHHLSYLLSYRLRIIWVQKTTCIGQYNLINWTFQNKDMSNQLKHKHQNIVNQETFFVSGCCFMCWSPFPTNWNVWTNQIDHIFESIFHQNVHSENTFTCISNSSKQFKLKF